MPGCVSKAEEENCISTLEDVAQKKTKEERSLFTPSPTSTLSCIANWQDMFYLFQKDTKGNRTALIPSSRFLHPLLLIHINHYPDGASGVYYNNGLTINSSSYRHCQLSDSEDECAMIAVYSQSIFNVYPAALLLCLSAVLQYFTHFGWWLGITIVEISWTLPLPFCSGHYVSEIAGDCVYEVCDSPIIACSSITYVPYMHCTLMNSLRLLSSASITWLCTSYFSL